MAKGVIDLLKVVDVPHHQAKSAAQGLGLADSLGEVGIKAASIIELREGVAQAHRLRLGKGRRQPLDLALGGLEPGLEVGGLVLHTRILRNQKLDNDADLSGVARLGRRLSACAKQTEYLS